MSKADKLLIEIISHIERMTDQGYKTGITKETTEEIKKIIRRKKQHDIF